MRTLAPEERRDLAKDGARGASAGRGRAKEIVASLRADEPADVFDAFWQLDALPADEVREALAPWTGPLSDLAARPLRLRMLSVARDADVLDLGPLAEEQLRLAGKSWDGDDLAPEERLDGELEGSFAGTLERRVLADTDAPGEVPLFDVLLFAEDSGVVFTAGTTNVVALVAYGKVEMRDRRTRSALEEAVAPVEAAPASSRVAAAAPGEAGETAIVAPTERRRTTRAKTVAKKTTAKKTTAKKTAAKKIAKKTAKKATR